MCCCHITAADSAVQSDYHSICWQLVMLELHRPEAVLQNVWCVIHKMPVWLSQRTQALLACYGLVSLHCTRLAICSLGKFQHIRCAFW